LVFNEKWRKNLAINHILKRTKDVLYALPGEKDPPMLFSGKAIQSMATLLHSGFDISEGTAERKHNVNAY
jgi:hypothetical protein